MANDLPILFFSLLPSFHFSTFGGGRRRERERERERERGREGGGETEKEGWRGRKGGGGWGDVGVDGSVL